MCNSLPEQNLIKEEQATPWEVVCSQLNPTSSIAASHSSGFIWQVRVRAVLTHTSGHSVARLQIMALFLSTFYALFICFLKTPTSTPALWTEHTRHRGSHAPFPKTRRLCFTPRDTSQPNPIPKFFAGTRDTRRSMAEPRESSQQYAIHFHTCYGSHGVSHTVTAHTKYSKPISATF